MNRVVNYHEYSSSDWLALAYQRLTAGARERNHPYHIINIASVCPDRTPDARFVVLRGFDSKRRELLFHTDARSPKIQQFLHSERVVASMYAPADQFQLRLYGRVALHKNDALTHQRWHAMRPESRVCYAQSQAPGSQRETPYCVQQDELDDDHAASQLIVCVIRFDRLDLLQLSHIGHVRLCCKWDSQGELTTHWVAP